MAPKLKAVVISLVWFVVGGAVAALNAMLCLFVGMGGMQTPPAFWGTTIIVSVFVLPVTASLAGVPVAYLVAREKPALKLGLILAALNLFAIVAALSIVLIWRPKY